MVRLKDFPKWTWQHIENVFQFHYGTIKSATNAENNQGSSKFQFHYGTIKRTELFPNITGMIIFQFHYGTIKRTYKSS